MPTLADFRLSSRLRAVFAQLARVIVTDEVDRLGITDDVVNGIETFLRTIPTPMRLGLVAGVHTFDQSARAVPSSRGRSFARLPLDLAEAHFARWWENPVGHQIARGVRMFVTFSYYEHPAVRAQLGYTPDAWIAKVKAQRQARFREQIVENEARMTAPSPLGKRLPEAGAPEAQPAEASDVQA